MTRRRWHWWGSQTTTTAQGERHPDQAGLWQTSRRWTAVGRADWPGAMWLKDVKGGCTSDAAPPAPTLSSREASLPLHLECANVHVEVLHSTSTTRWGGEGTTRCALRLALSSAALQLRGPVVSCALVYDDSDSPATCAA